MNCDKCGGKTRVVESAPTASRVPKWLIGRIINAVPTIDCGWRCVTRRRSCEDCSKSFFTVELTLNDLEDRVGGRVAS